MMSEEVPLVGGRSSEGVVRVGDTVRRPTGPWTETVHRFLEHVLDRDFDGAPQPMGYDDRGREVLEFIPGDVLDTPQDPEGSVVLAEWPVAWRSEDALASAGMLIRRLHDASAGFRTDHAAWRLSDHAMRAGETVCHGDLAPWNSVYRQGSPVAFIDWDGMRPDRPELDLASAAWAFVPLVDGDNAAILGFESVDHGKRLGVFLDAYGLDDRSGFVDALRIVKIREVDRVRFWDLGPNGAADFMDGVAVELRWLATHEHELNAAI